MDRFLLADNPRRKGGGLAIIHTIEPISIIECIIGHVECPSGSYYQHFTYTNTDNVMEEWTLRVHHLFTTEMDSERDGAIVEHLLARAWRWYRSYLGWEDDNIDTDNYSQHN